MMSTWKAMPDRSSIIEPGKIGELTHPSIDHLLERTTDLADPERLVPLRHGLEIRPNEPIDIVPGRARELRRILDHEAGAAVQGAPDPEGDGERVTAFDPPVARAEQPERRPRPRRQHEMARQGHPVPIEQAD